MALTTQINWFDYDPYIITDISKKLYEPVKSFMLEHFRSYELFKVLGIQEEPGIENEFLKIVKHILDNDCSIIVLNKETNDIKGVALLKWMSQEWRSWMALQMLIDCQHFKELNDMVQSCFKKFALKLPKGTAADSLHLFSYHLCEDLVQDKTFLQHFFNAIHEVALHMHMPRVTYMCLSTRNRQLMEMAGFEEVIRIIYSMHVFKGRRPFDRLRDINEMYGGLYERKVPPLQPYQELIFKPITTKDLKEGQKENKEKGNHKT